MAEIRSRSRFIPIVALALLFAWFYGQFATSLYFVMDDYIETWHNLASPVSVVIRDNFAGRVNWSGYRPLAYSVRAIMAHLFGMEHVAGYHVVGLGLHLANTLMVYVLARYLIRSTWWAFCAAALFLLLPSHNEAVLYMDANANLIALCAALAAILMVVRYGDSIGWLGMGLSWLAYAMSVLAYEVMLPLPLFIALAELLDGRTLRQRRRIILYGGFAVVTVLLLVTRYAMMAGTLVPSRSDYAVTTDLSRVLYNYLLLGGQMFLLHTSPWLGTPHFANVREWLPLTDPAVYLAIIFALLICSLMLVVTWSEGPGKDFRRRWLVFAWGILWMAVLSLPFVALSGRSPENRYVYIPSVGYVVALAAILAVLGALGRVRILRYGLVAIPVAILAFYARVDASDLSEWTEAGQHARTFLYETKALLPELPANSRVIQIGVPGNVGSAYVFTTQESFHSAIQMLYRSRTIEAEAGDDKLLKFLAESPEALDGLYAIAYDADSRRVKVIDWLEVCPGGVCTQYPLATGQDHAMPDDGDVQFADGIWYHGYRIATVYQADRWAIAPLLQTCWHVERSGLPDYTFFVHLTDSAGNTVAQADHVLRRSGYSETDEAAVGGWPADELVCDTVTLPQDPDNLDQPITIRGGLWLPDEGRNPEVEAHGRTEIDEFGRMIIGPLQYGATQGESEGRR